MEVENTMWITKFIFYKVKFKTKIFKVVLKQAPFSLAETTVGSATYYRDLRLYFQEKIELHLCDSRIPPPPPPVLKHISFWCLAYNQLSWWKVRRIQLGISYRRRERMSLFFRQIQSFVIFNSIHNFRFFKKLESFLWLSNLSCKMASFYSTYEWRREFYWKSECMEYMSNGNF